MKASEFLANLSGVMFTKLRSLTASSPGDHPNRHPGFPFLKFDMGGAAVVLILLIGLPVALSFLGVRDHAGRTQRTEEVAPEESITHRTGANLPRRPR